MIKIRKQIAFFLPTFRFYTGAIANINAYNIYLRPINYDAIIPKKAKYVKKFTFKLKLPPVTINLE